jgi:nicotinamide-nucleotide amidase
MEHVRILKQICDDARILVATAESVTVGHLQSMIAAVPGASTFFLGGITAYSIDQKVGILGVQRDLAEPVDCVSSQVAEQMAWGASSVFRADIGLATTGYAEPPDFQKSLIPHAFFAIWDKRESLNPVRAGKLVGRSADRVTNQRFYAEQVLRDLVVYLTSREGLDLKFQEVLQIERVSDGRYRLGQQIIENISDVEGAVKAVKRSIPITALQLSRPFEVMTTQGIMEGKPGDWLMQGVAGEIYVCPDDVFRQSYEYPL